MLSLEHMKCFGLLGYPIEHSLSPAIHNAAFQKAGLDWTYALWPTPPEGLASAIAHFRAQKLGGANVTIPHKESVIQHLDGLAPTAQAIGAVNTLYWNQNRLMGDNTDAPGFLADLHEKQVPVTGHTALILGTGGSAKAVLYALTQAGMKVESWSRRSALPPLPADLTVNCTPGLDLEILNQVQFTPGQVLYDLSYASKPTAIMQKALDCGAQAFSGLGMLEKQAALSFEIWKSSEKCP